jgi:uncharacterized protein YerC
MKRRLKDLTKQEMIATLDALYTAASGVKGRDKVKLFLRDLLTPSERVMLGRRIIIARMLLARITYDEIIRRMKVGKTTVARVDRWLQDQFPGFENALKELEKEYERREWKHTTPELGTFAYLKKKYPLHFLLFPTPKPKHKKPLYP